MPIEEVDVTLVDAPVAGREAAMPSTKGWLESEILVCQCYTVDRLVHALGIAVARSKAVELPIKVQISEENLFHACIAAAVLQYLIYQLDKAAPIVQLCCSDRTGIDASLHGLNGDKHHITVGDLLG